jgi:beta-phosphoglucomutase-like phosphatase (HAD superfamily)
LLTYRNPDASEYIEGLLYRFFSQNANATMAGDQSSDPRPGPLPIELLKGIDQLRLDVATIVGIHDDTTDIQALRAATKAVGSK